MSRDTGNQIYRQEALFWAVIQQSAPVLKSVALGSCSVH